MSLSDVSPSAPDARTLLPDILSSLRENSPLLLFAVLFGCAPIVMASLFSVPTLPYTRLWLDYLGFIVTAGIALFATFALWYLYHTRIRKTPDFQQHARQRIRSDFLSRDRLLLALPILALWPITASAFSYLKSIIPLVQPYHLDPLLHEWDRALHFGMDPWRILHPIVGYTWVTYIINLVYALWFFVLQATLVMQSCASGDRKRRMHFLLTFAFSWALIGTLAATLMSSAGPCYYGRVVEGADPYAPLMAYLHNAAANLSLGIFGQEVRIPFTALMLQDLLWQSQIAGDFGIAKGISAAPSMHIASSWIIWRLAWTMGRTARVFGSLFLLLIFVGSIHLGWHYAIDGYLAIAAAWALWRLIGWLLDQPSVQSYLWPDRVRGAAGAVS